jgi:hypothetical protein
VTAEEPAASGVLSTSQQAGGFAIGVALIGVLVAGVVQLLPRGKA